uniref:Uncharacterized protein n=1 Tax=Sphaerodactylus townsendi TaxID=933632 RepID=A0ACB8FUU1_9SAUR
MQFQNVKNLAKSRGSPGPDYYLKNYEDSEHPTSRGRDGWLSQAVPAAEDGGHKALDTSHPGVKLLVPCSASHKLPGYPMEHFPHSLAGSQKRRRVL